MNPKNTWMLVVLAGGLFAFIYFFERHIQAPPVVVAKVLPNLIPDDVSSIEVHPRGQFAIRVERVTGGWQMTQPIVYSVQNSAVEGFLQAWADLSPQRPITAEELQGNKNIARDYGFETPLATILIQQGDDQRQLELGNATPLGDGLYARVVGTEGIDIIATGFASVVPGNAGQWRDPTFVNLQGLAFDGLSVMGGSSPLKFQRDGQDKPWNMLQPIKARANTQAINHLLDDLQLLSVGQFWTDDSNADLEPYGLQPPQLQLTFTQGSNQVLSLAFGKSPTNDPSMVYARTNGSSSIVLVARENLKPWSADYSTFRDPHMISFTMSDQPGSVECYGPDGRTNFIVQRSTNGILMVTDGQGQPFPAEPNAVFTTIKGLAELRVVPWAPEQFARDAVADSDLPGLGLAPNPVHRYVLRAVPTNETARLIAQLDFGMPNTNNPGTIATRRSDLAELSVFAVDSAEANQLPTSALQLRLRRIWAFDATNISHLQIQANGQTPLRWDHKRENLWQPMPSGITDEVKGMSIENFVNYLGLLTAAAWVGRGEPTAEYGFNGNSEQVSVTFTNGTQSRVHTLTFGGIVPESGGARYACTQMPDGQNWIFTISAKDMKELVDYMPMGN